jgi:hypothetical protein
MLDVATHKPIREGEPVSTLTSLTSQRVLDESMTVLQSHIPLEAHGYRCQSADLWRVLLAATARGPSG